MFGDKQGRRAYWFNAETGELEALPPDWNRDEHLVTLQPAGLRHGSFRYRHDGVLSTSFISTHRHHLSHGTLYAAGTSVTKLNNGATVLGTRRHQSFLYPIRDWPFTDYPKDGYGGEAGVYWIGAGGLPRRVSGPSVQRDVYAAIVDEQRAGVWLATGGGLTFIGEDDEVVATFARRHGKPGHQRR